MLKNYFKIALRNLWKNKLYAGLNISGLGIGLGCFLVIMLFVKHELSFDHNANSGRILRVLNNDINSSSGRYKDPYVTPSLGPELAKNSPYVDAYTRFWKDSYGGVKLKSKNDSSSFSPVTLVDQAFAEIFDLDFLIGDISSSFKRKNSALITETEAIKVYGSPDAAINQELIIKGKYFVIDGIVASSSANSSFTYGVLLPFDEVQPLIGLKLGWESSSRVQTFFLAKDITYLAALESSIKSAYEANGRMYSDQSLEPLEHVHFSLDVKDGITGKSDYQYVIVFSGAAILILLCAVFNYINLTLSQSLQRTKEVGVRRVVGSKKRQVFLQFFIESLIYSSASILLAIVFAEFLIPELEELFGRQVGGIIYSLNFFFWIVLFATLLSVVGSAYPTIVSFKNRMANMLQGSGNKIFDTNRLIGAVTSFQIVVFIILVCVAFIGKRQLEFLQNENLGFDNENVLLIDMSDFRSLTSKIELLKNELTKLPGVESVSRTSQVPPGTSGVEVNDNVDYNIYSYSIDENFLKTLDIKLIAGRNFNKEDQALSLFDSYDPEASEGPLVDVLINEVAAKKFELPEDPIGVIIPGAFSRKRVIGLVGDFHYVSKKEVIDPVVFKKTDMRVAWKLAVKLKNGSVRSAMEEIEESYAEITGETNMDYYFLDTRFNEQYSHEIIMITMVDAFTLVALIIAFIGLYGQSSYNANGRLKEMGIRKILGANFYEIQKALNSLFIKRLCLAVLIAVPLVVYWTRMWLSSFAYQIELPFFLIVIAIISASFFVIVAISVQSIKTHLINPVEILRSE